MLETPANAKTQIREAVAAIGAKGLDATVVAVEDALAQAWLMERRGVMSPRDVPEFVDAAVNALKKLAPPPPKKVKFSEPLRKILPRSSCPHGSIPRLRRTGSAPTNSDAIFSLASSMERAFPCWWVVVLCSRRLPSGSLSAPSPDTTAEGSTASSTSS